jgi:hypothetical protein
MFAISCTQGQTTPSSSNPTPPASPSESPGTTLPVTHTSSPIPTGNFTTPVIQAYQDLKALVNKDPAKIDNSNFPITPVEALRPTTQAPQINMTKYALTVDGLVDTPLTLTYGDILKYPSVSATLLLICPGVFVDNAEWTGVPVKTLLDQAGPDTALRARLSAASGRERKIRVRVGEMARPDRSQVASLQNTAGCGPA